MLDISTADGAFWSWVVDRIWLCLESVSWAIPYQFHMISVGCPTATSSLGTDREQE